VEESGADEVREIPLSKGQVALVDDEDYEMLTGMGVWYAMKTRNCYYAVRKGERRHGVQPPTILMHVVIMGQKGIDHINGDGTDNRRSNLRPCNHAQNMQNSRLARDNTSGHKGVYFDGRRNKWFAKINAFGKSYYLGQYDRFEDAVAAREEAALKYHGAFAR
jgi:hypothetical protein